MGEVNLRRTHHNRLKIYLKRVEDNATIPLDYASAKETLIRAEEVWAKYEEVQAKLIYTAADDAALQLQEKEGDKVEETYYKLRSQLRPLIESLDPTAGKPTTSTPNIRLPAIELPLFNGNIADWTSFKDLFTAAVGGNANLGAAQKLQYLKSSVRGEPASLIRSLSTTDSNYSAAWTILNERYDNQREIVHALINKLLNISPVKTESSTELQLLLDNFSECLRALQVLKKPVDEWNDILVVLLLNKIDGATRREWAIRQSGTDLPKYDDLKKFLRAHVVGLQSSDGSGGGQPDKRRERAVKVNMVASAKFSCLVCSEGHPIYQCQDFRGKPVVERHALAKKLNLCFNCLGKSHTLNDCSWNGTCRKCGRRHHTLLHFDSTPKPAAGAAPPASSKGPEVAASSQPKQPSSKTVNTHHVEVKADTRAVLMTAMVNVKDRHGALQPCRVFIDQGSEANFISEECCNRLGLVRHSSNVKVVGFGGASVGHSRGAVCTTLHSKFNNKFWIQPTMFVLSKLTGLMPGNKMASEWTHLRGLQLADPLWYKPGVVDITIGNPNYHQVLLHQRRVSAMEDAPIGWDTIFGWAVSGPCPAVNERINIFQVQVDPVEDILRRFWETEELPTTRQFSVEETACEKHFIATHRRDEEGRFVVSVPFTDLKSRLGRTRDSAVQRFYQVERRMQRDENFKEKYLDFMKEYETMGHMVMIPDAVKTEVEGETAYLPHHGVLNNSSTTTKLRVVFDGSVKSTRGMSLNDTMMVGPTVQEELYDTLLRVRMFPVVVKADVAKMFRQFKITEEDQNYHRIVWRDSPTSTLKDYKLTTVTYGTACAPYLATRCLHQLALDCAGKYPAASRALMKNAYVDDILGGEDSTEKAIHLYQELSAAVATAKLELRKWTSNDPEVVAAIPEELRETGPLSFHDEETVKALGIQWHPCADVFKFKGIEFKHTGTLTKRKLLSNAARVFDPLGLISCFSIRAKILLQDLWKLNCGWDEEVTATVQQQWNEYKEDLEKLTKLSIPRRILISSANYEIQGFSDSSEKGLGAVIYIRSFSESGDINVSFVTSKSRVAPVKLVSLPRLELEAALMLAKLVQRVVECLELKGRIMLWSDSTITLKWIEGAPHKWKTFIGNRVAKIQRITSIENWRHVPGSDNPADLASRGVPASELLTSDFWWKGPKWLSEPGLPVFNSTSKLVGDLEERKIVVNRVSVEPGELVRFSSYLRLRRVTAFMYRFMYNCNSTPNQPKRTGPLTVNELNAARDKWVKYVQSAYFQDDINALKKVGKLKPSSKLRSLHPYLDNQGILRVAGRLEKANLPEERKHQIILPGCCHFTNLIVRHVHYQLLHGGFQVTWASLQSEYWIVGGRDKVRHFIRKCVPCRRYRAKTAEQLMGNLPQARVTVARPFLNSGVDYAGPFVLKNPVGRAPKTYKGYMCLFVCMTTKAIHLEPVSSLSTEAFLEALKRFVSRRGICAHLYSDCGTNFVGAEKELQKLMNSQEVNEAIVNDLSGKGIVWHFNPPAAPHHGGLWEAGVKSAKFHLRRVIGNHPITYEQFHTILCQIEAVLNSRPLYALSSDPTDLEVLTPAHFLIGERLTAIPALNVMEIPKNRLNQFQLQQQRVQHFWRRWSAEYLNTLQQRNKWRWETDNVKVDDLVLIVEETSPGTWKMGRIVEVHVKDEKHVRVVSVKTGTGVIKRPITKLVVLVNSDEN